MAAGARILQITARSAARISGGKLAFASNEEVPADAVRRFLGEIDGVPYFCATVASEDESDAWATLRDLGASIDDLTGAMFAAAIGLEQWHQRHARCPICGTETAESQAGWTRTCPADGSTHFPRTDPAVIMVVTKGEGEDAHCLLGRGPAWPAGQLSTLAGFVEPGESLEATVAREVFEEVGVRVTDIQYLASQPWPFPSSLMVGFSARLEGADEMTLDPVEMVEAGWFTREEVRIAGERTDAGAEPDANYRLQYISPKLSISRWLLDEWVAGRVQ